MKMDEFYSLPKPTMLETMVALGLDKEVSVRKNNPRVKCPHCKGNSSSLSIKLDDEYFKCFKCDTTGNSLKLYGFFKYDYYDDSDYTKEVYSNLKAEIYGINLDSIEEYEVVKVMEYIKNNTKKVESSIPKVKRNSRATETTIHAYYHELVKDGLMDDFTLNDLRRRGFEEGDAQVYGYSKTLKKTETEGLFKDIPDSPKGVPGFYKKENKWQLVDYVNGYYIAIKNIFGVIHGMQIHVNRSKEDENRDAKYIALSSANNQNGTVGESKAHFVGDLLETAFITEGPTKANLFHKFTGHPCYAITGVNAQDDLIKQLEIATSLFGLKTVYLMFDMDQFDNPNVEKALKTLTEKINQLEHKPTVMSIQWDKNFKGIDDYLFHLKQNNQLQNYLDNMIDPLVRLTEINRVDQLDLNEFCLI